jgi:hypothetical protein
LVPDAEVDETNNNKLAYLTWLLVKGIPVPNWMNRIFKTKAGMARLPMMGVISRISRRGPCSGCSRLTAV